MSRESKQYEHYIIEISSILVDYSFGLDHDKKSIYDYSEYLQPTVSGKLVAPSLDGIDDVEIVLIPSRKTDPLSKNGFNNPEQTP